VATLVALLGIPILLVAWWVAGRLPEPHGGGVEDSSDGDVRV
jgi:hypothetical protein